MGTRATLGAVALGLIGCGGSVAPPPAPRAPVVEVGSTCIKIEAEATNVAALLDGGHILRAAGALEAIEPECRARLGTRWVQGAEALADLRRFEPARQHAQAILESALPIADKRRARAILRRVADAGKLPTETDRALALYDSGLAAERAGRLRRASRLYTQSWEALQPNGPALLGAARVAQQRGKTAEAQRLFDRTLVEVEATTGESVRPVRRPLAEASASGPLAFGRNDSLLLVANASAVEVWDLALQTTLYRVNSQTPRPLARFSPDGRQLALGPVRDQGDIEIRHAAGGYLLRQLDGHADSLEHLEFFDAGKLLVSADFSGLVLVRDAANGKELARIDFGTDVDVLLPVPARNAVLLANNRDDIAALYELRTGKQLWRQQVAPQNVEAVSPDGTVFAMSSPGTKDDDFAKTLTIADIATGEPIEVIPLPAAQSYDIAFGSDDRLLARIMDRPGSYRFEVWSTADAEPVVSVSSQRRPEFRLLPGEHVAVWIDGKLASIDLRDDSVSPTSIRTHYTTAASPSSWTASESGRLIAWSPERGRASVQSLTGGTPQQLNIDHVVRARSLARIGAESLAVGDDHRIRRCDPKPGRCQRWIDTGFAPQQLLVAQSTPTLLALTDDRVVVFDWSQRRIVTRSPAIAGLRGAALSGNGVRFATLTYDGGIAVFDARNANLLAEFVGSPGNGPTLALDPNGEVLAAADGNMNGRIVTVSTKNERQFTEEVDAETAALSTDGRLVAFAFSVVSAEDSGGEDMTEVRIFDRNTGENRSTFRVRGLFGQELAFSPNGRRLVVNAGMGPTSLVDLETGQVVATLDDAESIAFSEDGRWIAGICFDGDLAFYDANDGHRLLGLYLSGAANAAVALAPDGRFELLGSAPLSHLECIAGSLALPAEVCRDKFETKGLVEESLHAAP
jgi:WD40 repeat protein